MWFSIRIWDSNENKFWSNSISVLFTNLLNTAFLALEAKVEYRVLKGYVIGEPYDYGSVMHYGFNFFSVDPKRPIIVKLMPGGKQMGQREGFSDLDLRKINKCYNCTSYISEYTMDTWSMNNIVNWNYVTIYTEKETMLMYVWCYFYRIDSSAKKGNNQNSFR